MPPTLVTIDPSDARTASGDHPLIAHYEPYLVPGEPAWQIGSAVGVVYDYWDHPNVTIVGEPAEAAALARAVGESVPLWMSLPAAAQTLLPAGFLIRDHGWGFRWVDRPVGSRDGDAAWLDASEEPEVEALLQVAFPEASTRPGSPRARRWAGIRGPDGRLLACAVDSTGAPSVGFVASITTLPAARGRGLGKAITAWTLDRLVAEHGRAALWLYGGNTTAKALYARLGMQALDLVSGAPPATHTEAAREDDD